MDTPQCIQPGRIQFDLPEWLDDYRAGYRVTTDPEARMAFVVEAARQNVMRQTGGPFAAAIFEMKSGRLISLGVNLVTRERLSILHAEMVAIALAQRCLGTYDLSAPPLPAHELFSSAQPCAMCFGAIPWSGIQRVVTGARSEDVQDIGFDEGPIPQDWREELNRRGIETLCDIQRPLAIGVLEAYRAQGGDIYNPRGRKS